MFVFLEVVALSDVGKETKASIGQIILAKNLCYIPSNQLEDNSIPLGSWKLSQSGDNFSLYVNKGCDMEAALANDPIWVNKRKVTARDLALGKMEIKRGDAITTRVLVERDGADEIQEHIFTIPRKLTM